jgi:hypothetical protein
MMIVIAADMTATMIEVIEAAGAAAVDAAALAGDGCTVAKYAVSASRKLT